MINLVKLTLQAQQILEAADWDYASAMTGYHNTQELAEPEDGESETEEGPSSNASAGRRLGGAPAAGEPVTEGKSKSKSKKGKPKFATLGDFSNAPPEGEDSDDTQDEDKNQDMFAGGEKSGLAVKNPDDIKKKILDQARKWVLAY